MIKKNEKCRSCGSYNLIDLFSLGNLAVSDFVERKNIGDGYVAPLTLTMCDSDKGGCSLVQLGHTVPSEVMYRNYWYESGINKTMTTELSDIAQDISATAQLKSGDFVIDIGSNDGTLLRAYDVTGLNTVGFEPALNLLAAGKAGNTVIIPDFFSKEGWHNKFGDAKAKGISAIGMFYDLDDPNQFLEDVNACLHDDGVFIIQMMYMPYAIERNAFDGICHEHLEYYTILSLEKLLARFDLQIIDVAQRINVNEGSLRIFVRKKNGTLQVAGGLQRVQDLRDKEKKGNFNKEEAYIRLSSAIERAKQQTIEFLREEKAKGKIIHGYAASTKGNTTLQYYGVGPDLLDAIADRNPNKWGLYTVSSGIPVISEEESRSLRPDYYFVLAWHFIPEFVEREKKFLAGGGHFIVSMPEFRLIGA